MNAIVYHAYGAPDVLRCEEIAKPSPADDEILIKVRAASANPMDHYFMRGEPFLVRGMTGLRKPKTPRLGVDLAGEVEAVGSRVTQFQPGDAVFGAGRGAFAEYVCARETSLAPKPANVSFEQAAAIPTAGLTALQGMRDRGHLQPGQTVLIIGAAGGVGTFAVQIAKAFGAHVTGVCSTKNVSLVRAIGADVVIDYTQTDFTSGPARYDLILSLAGKRSPLACRRVMSSSGIFVWVGGSGGRWMGPFAGFFKTLTLARVMRRPLVVLRTSMKRDDLITLKELVEASKVTPVVGGRYALCDAADAMRYLEQGHAGGKAVITVA